MGVAVDTEALAGCIRDTLDTFLEDHPGLAEAEVAVGEARAHGILLQIDGFAFTLFLRDAHGMPLGPDTEGQG